MRPLSVAARSHPAHSLDWGHATRLLAYAILAAGLLGAAWWAAGQLVSDLATFTPEAYWNAFTTVSASALLPGYLPLVVALVLPILAVVALLGIILVGAL